MDKRINDQAKVYRRSGKIRSAWKKIVNTLACVVVFCTTYALILPAITMQGTFSCGMEEHVHDEKCFANTAVISELICTHDVHVHGEECYDEYGDCVCGVADYLLHTHTQQCYDADGVRICGLPEMTGHIHEEACYVLAEISVPTQVPHAHTDDCYTTLYDYDTLICPMAETEGHSHGESCYGEDALVCTVAECQPHAHGDSCYGETVRSCGMEEAAGHTHGSGCYGEKLLTCDQEHEHVDDCYGAAPLVCTLTESAGHSHSNACYEQPLICTMEEVSGHAHGEGCYEKPLVCNQEESEAHLHSDACYAATSQLTCGLEDGQLVDTTVIQTEKTLTCRMEERVVHTHAAECYSDGQLSCGKLQLNEHNHTDACVSVTEQQVEEYLICEVESHTHALICYADPTADVETTEIWESSMRGLRFTGNAAEDLLAVARSQLGYVESTANYIVLEDGITIRGYSRYGAWSGDDYAEWAELFVEFCLHYAGIAEEDFPRPTSNKTWVETLADYGFFVSKGYVPQPGDLMFLNIDDVNYVGIVSSASGDGYVTAILGDYHNEVRQDTFSLSDTSILGYAMMSQMEAFEELAAEEAATTEEAEAANTGKHLSAVMTFELGEGMIGRPELSARAFANAATYSADSASGIDMASMITSIKVYHKTTAWGDTWEEVGTDGTIQSGDLVRFAISYTVPADTLSTNNNSIYYQLPVTSISEAMSGTVYDSNGAAVGTYTISTSGMVTIEFYDNYVQENASGVAIDGVINFDTNAEELDADDDGKISLDFTDNSSVEIEIQQTVTNDLTVSKEATSYDPKTGLISYTITVNSLSGTAENINLTDLMGNVAYYSEFKVESSTDGDITSQVTGALTQGSTNLNLTLPQMQEGETYTITYIGSVINGNGHVTANNGVTVTSKDSQGNTLTSSDSATVEYEYNMLLKTGTVNSDGTVTWTITIGQGGQELSGWVLSDLVNGKNLTQAVTISYNLKGDDDTTTLETVEHNFSTNGNFTFPAGAYGPVTVTYTTSLDYNLDANSMTNTATLTHPDGSPSYSQTVNVQKPGEEGTWNPYNPLSKDSTGLSVNSDGETATIGWSFIINADKGPIYPDSTTGYWYFSDTLQNNQYYTTEQWDALVEAIQNALIAAYNAQDGSETWTKENVGNLCTIEPSTGENGNYGFTVKVYKALDKGSKIEFTYYSTGSIGDGSSQVYFQNSASVNNKVWDKGAAVYNPTVQKVDGSNGSASNTTHSYVDLTNGIVTWQINVYMPDVDGLTGDVVITEILPSEVSLSSLSMTLPDNRSLTLSTGDTSVTYGDVNGTVTVSEVDSSTNTFTITISQALAQAFADQNLTFTVNTSLDDPFDGNYVVDTSRIESVDLTNSVSVTIGETNLGSDTHTQTITNQNTTQQLDKSAAINQDNKNLVDYTLEINPDEIDLDSSGDTITVEDTLSFWIYPSQYVIGATLVESSLKVYAVGDDGNRTEITNYSYAYTQNIDQPEWSTAEYKLLNNLVFTVPDNTHLVIEYQYYFTGKEGVATNISNTATIRGVSQNGQDTYDTYFTVSSSGAIANLGSVSVFKVEKGNYSVQLTGAEFELYKWNGTAWVFDQIVKSDGKSSLDLENLTINQAYYLIEVNAPSGYILDQTRHYFMIHDANTTTYPMSAPSNFPNTAYYTRGGKVYIPNEAASTQVSVEKIWKDADGNVVEAPDGADVNVKLMKVWNLYPGGVKPSGWGTADATVNLSFGEYSYDSKVYSQQISAKVGDIITITLTTQSMSSNGPAGLMEVTSTANNHLPYTLTGNTYTFTYLVTGNANLHGWVYPENVSGCTVNYTVTSAENVTLTGEPEVADTVTLSGDNLTHTFTGLHLYDLYTSAELVADGADTGIGRIQGYYTYYVEEINVPEGYEVTYSADGHSYTSTSPSVSGGKLYVQNAPEQADGKLSITVDKEWVNQNGGATSAPSGVGSVEFKLYKIVTETASNKITVYPKNLTTVWEGYYESGTKLMFTVYTKSAGTYVNLGYTSINTSWETVGYGNSQETVIAGETVYVVTIGPYTVDGSVDMELTVSDLVKITVDADTTGAESGSTTETLIGTYTLTADSWTRTIPNLEPGTYKIVETTTGYTTTYTVNGESGNSGEFTTDGNFVITNMVEEEMTQVTVNKAWKESARENDVPESITFKLYQNGNPYDADTTDDVVHTPYTLTPVDGIWSMTISDLPKYDSSGNAYEYTVKEVTVTGYYGRVSTNQATDGTFLYTITNEPVTEIGVQKDWAEGTTATNVIVQLWRFESDTPPEDNNTIGMYPAPDLTNATLIAKATLGYDGDGNATWKKTFKNRPLYEYDEDGNIIKYYSYVIVEANSGYYVTYSINGAVVDNDPRIVITNWPSTEVTVEKVWKDGDGNVYTPSGSESVTLKLMQIATTVSGDSTTQVITEYAAVTLPSSDSSWSHTFTELPTTITDGTSTTTYTYFVVEEGIDQYNVTYTAGENSEPVSYTLSDGTTVSGSAAVGSGTITVTNTVASTSITVNKVWLDLSGAELSPDSTHITFKLYQNGALYSETRYTIKVNDDGKWTITIDGLPVTDANGVAYVYTVGDEIVNYTDSTGYVKDYSKYYTPEYSDLTNGTITITNTKTGTNIGVTKKWVEGTTPAPVTFYLYRIVNDSLPAGNDEVDGTYTESQLPDFEAMVQSGKASIVKKVTLCAAEKGTDGDIEVLTNSSKTWQGLPLVGTEDGKTVYYSYFAVEVTDGYTPTYSTATPITGEVRITVTNAAYYELPQTGGSGTHMYTFGGLALIVWAIFLMYNHRKGRKEDAFS